MQQDNEPDEILALLDGRCILFIGEGNNNALSITGVNLGPRKIYNAKCGV